MQWVTVASMLLAAYIMHRLEQTMAMHMMRRQDTIAIHP